MQHRRNHIADARHRFKNLLLRLPFGIVRYKPFNFLQNLFEPLVEMLYERLRLFNDKPLRCLLELILQAAAFKHQLPIKDEMFFERNAFCGKVLQRFGFAFQSEHRDSFGIGLVGRM
jgi:hypothetical protein